MSDSTRRRPEPEIIPPGEPLPRREPEIWATRDRSGTHQVYLRPIGPVGATMLALGVGAAAVLGFFFLLSTAIIGLAAIGVLTIAGIIAGILRGPPRRLR
jgi:hypothetical protein